MRTSSDWSPSWSKSERDRNALLPPTPFALRVPSAAVVLKRTSGNPYPVPCNGAAVIELCATVVLAVGCSTAAVDASLLSS